MEKLHPVDDSVLISLAMLHVNWSEQGHSYVDSFVPFAAQCMRDAPHDEISRDELQRALQDRFGLNIPQVACDLVISRAVHMGLARRERGVLVREGDAIARFAVEEVKAEFLRQHQALVLSLIDFAKDRGVTLSDDEAEEALLNHVAANSLPILRSALFGRPLLSGESEMTRLEVLVSTFVAAIFESDPREFGYLETVVKGSMLATAMFLPDPSTNRRKVDNLTVYLDTPVMLNLLGLHGSAELDATTELIELLKSIGARIACFQHSLQETQGVMEGCAADLRALRRPLANAPVRKVLRHAINQSISSSEMEMQAATLGRTLRRMGVNIEEVPSVPPTGDYVDEARIEAVVRSRLHYWSEGTLLCDVKSICAIGRLRHGRPQTVIDTAVAILLTNNTGLVAACRELFDESGRSDRVPICTVGAELGTVAWLKQPVAAPDLPRKLILAECYSAMEPIAPLWDRYLHEIDRQQARGDLIEEDYVFLRYSLEAGRALMDVTLGETSELTSGSIEDILRRGRERTARELVESVQDTRRKGEARESELLERIDALQASIDESTLRATQYREAQDKRLFEVAHFWGRATSWAVVVLIAAVVVGAGSASLLGLPASIGWLGALFAVCALGALFLQWTHLSIGVTIKDIKKRVEESITKRFHRLLRSLFRLGPDV